MERERITISIKRDILRKIDNTIDGVIVRNRSHAIENLVSQSFGPQKSKNAVILIGGENAQESLPIVKEALIQFKQAGFAKVYIALGSLAEKVKEILGNGREYGLVIEYLEEGEGTGGALLPLKNIFNDLFVVINPGKESISTIQDLLEFHASHNIIATVATENLEAMKGIYIFEPSIFNYIPEGFSMLEEDIFPLLAKDNALIVKPY